MLKGFYGFFGDLAGKMMVRWWFGVEPSGRVKNEYPCLSEEKRKKIKKKKRDGVKMRGEEWWIGGGTCECK